MSVESHEPVVDVLDTEQAGSLVIRGSVLRLIGFGGGLVMSVVATALLLRHLGVEDAGRYNTVISLIAIVGGLTDAGMGNIGVREYAALEPDARGPMMRDLLGLRIALTIAGVVLAVGFGLVAGYSGAMLAGTALAGAGLVLQIAQNTVSVPLSVQLRLGTMSALDIARNGLNAVGIVVLVIAGAGLVALLAVPLPAAAILLLATLPLVRGTVSLRPRAHLAAWRALLADALPYALATAIGIIYIYLTVIVLGFVTSDEQVGLFSAAFRVFIVVAGISALVVQSAFPVLARAARDDGTRLRYAVRRLFEGNLVVGALVGLCTVFGAPVAIRVVAGPDFADAVGVLRVQGAALVMTFVAGVGSYALLALRRHGAVLAVNAAALTVSLVLTLVLGAADGARGGAVANLAGESVLAVAALVALARGPDAVRVQLGVVARVAAAVAVAAGAALLTPGPALGQAAVAGAVYLAAAHVLGAVPAEVRHALLRRGG